ncbi:Non-catalytic module family DOC2, partial [Piromyces sp. E2]
NNIECWAEKLNYPCCKKDNCMKFYVNDDGAWGFENFRWCGILDTEYCEKKATECWAEKLGYKCCPEDICTPYHTDDNGAWGVYNDDWCGI